MPESPWILREAKMPEHGQLVTFVTYDKFCYLGYLERSWHTANRYTDYWKVLNFDKQIELDQVEYWMPEPELPY